MKHKLKTLSAILERARDEIKEASPYLKLLIKSIFSNFKNITSKKHTSVYFLGNSYQGFHNLAQGLKKRGWRTISVNPSQGCPFSPHFDSIVDLTKPQDSIQVFIDIISHYKFLQVYNRAPDVLYTGSNWYLRKILSVRFLKIFGVKFIFSPSGCLDGSTSAEINSITKGLCEKCIWQGNYCNDTNNQARTKWLAKNCNIFSNEVDLPKKLAKSSIGFNLPILPVDSEVLNPDLVVPDKFKIAKNPEELVIFTAFGNQKLRTNELKDIKGKRFILAAIDKLLEEGYPIKHFHATEIPVLEMKYYQAQADIIVDQLNYGSIGSAAREGMMLGKPMICHISDKLRLNNMAMKDCPTIDATEENIYDVLKKLLHMSTEERKQLGLKARAWMLKWYDIDACAKRYEILTQRLLNKQELALDREHAV